MISVMIYFGDHQNTTLKTWELLDFQVYKYEIKMVEIHDSTLSLHICSLYDYETVDTFVVSILYREDTNSFLDDESPHKETGANFNATFAIKIGCGAYYFNESTYRVS